MSRFNEVKRQWAEAQAAKQANYEQVQKDRREELWSLAAQADRLSDGRKKLTKSERAERKVLDDFSKRYAEQAKHTRPYGSRRKPDLVITENMIAPEGWQTLTQFCAENRIDENRMKKILYEGLIQLPKYYPRQIGVYTRINLFVPPDTARLFLKFRPKRETMQEYRYAARRTADFLRYEEKMRK